mgnify:CR=1 FL=1
MPSFSQSVTDTTSVVLSNELARLIIQDLLQGDAAREEVIILKRKVDLQEQKIVSQEEIIARLNTQIENLEKVEVSRQDQLSNYQELSTKLEKDLVKEKRITTIFKSTTGVGLVVILVLTALG